jgi:hypothetical protein
VFDEFESVSISIALANLNGQQSGLKPSEEFDLSATSPGNSPFPNSLIHLQMAA